MAFDDRPAALTKTKTFGPPPACDCGKPCVIALATVAHTKTGRLSRGAASEFCGRDNHNNSNGILLDWYSFQSYDGYCAECWYGTPQPGRQKYTDKQISVAWRWFLNKITADSESLNGVFKPITLTPEQQDTAIEIVNYEAKRCGTPDAIPDQYKLAEVWAA